MTATVTEPPRLGDLVGGLGPALDRAGAAAPKASPTALAWRSVCADVAAGLDRDLEGGVLDRLAEGWAKAEALAQHAADRLGRDSFTVKLGSHDFDLKLDPGFTLTINGVDAGRLPIDLALRISLSGAVLTLRGGAITEVELGQVSISGDLEVAGVKTPLKLATPDFTLLGRHSLSHPAAISAAGAGP